MIDTHTHLYLPEFDADGSDGGAEAVTRAIAGGVDCMIFPNVDLTTIEPMRRLAARYPNNIRMAMGLHPSEIDGDYIKGLDTVHSELMTHREDYIAVGEIGIDLYWDKTWRDEQIKAFDIQCGWADREGLPVIIHCREGLDETLEVISGHPGLPAVFHSFGGTVADVERILKTGDYYFGINGILTFKKSTLPETIKAIPRERLLLETDSPYLAPVPKRGRRNESAYLPHTAAFMAETLGMTVNEVDLLTTTNARRLFKVP